MQQCALASYYKCSVEISKFEIVKTFSRVRPLTLISLRRGPLATR